MYGTELAVLALVMVAALYLYIRNDLRRGRRADTRSILIRRWLLQEHDLLPGDPREAINELRLEDD